MTPEKFLQRAFSAGAFARDGKNFAVWCPWCKPNDKQKRKLFIRVSDGVWHCWVCGQKSRSMWSLLRHVGASQDILKECDATYGMHSHRVASHEDATRVLDVTLPPMTRLLVTCSDVDPDVVAVKRYVLQRGLSERDMWYFKLCVSDDFKWRRRVIVPSFDADGKLNYFVGRTIDDGVIPRYKNVKVDRVGIVFNELNVDWKSRLTLCEGPFDLFKCGQNATCLLGSDISENGALLSNIVRHETPVTLMLDADMMSKKVPKIVKMLQSYDVDVTVAALPVDKDPGSMSKDAVEECVKAASAMSWESMLREKLKGVQRTSLRVI